MDKIEFPADMPEHVRRVIGTPTADAIRAWETSKPAAMRGTRYITPSIDCTSIYGNAHAEAHAEDRQRVARAAQHGDGR